jgi:hypothetical protein
VKELPEQIQNEISGRYKTTVSILVTQFLIVAILLIAAWFLAGKFYPFGMPTGNASFSIENLTDTNNGNTIATTLWITILAVAVSSFLLRRFIFAPNVLKDIAIIKGTSNLLKSLQTKTVLLAGLGVVIAILGLIIALISGNITDMLRAAIIAAIVLFINFPRKTAWQRLLAQAATKE